MSSTYSTSDQKEASYEFSITFLDACWESSLQKPVFDQSFMKYEIWQQQNIDFDPMVNLDKGLDCGGYTHEIVYLEGPRFGSGTNADLSFYTLIEQSASRMEMVGVMNDFAWLGIHTIQIKATNGKYDSGPQVRGANGLFNSVYSAPIKLQIINPCD